MLCNPGLEQGSTASTGAPLKVGGTSLNLKSPTDVFVNSNSSFYHTSHFTRKFDIRLAEEGLQKHRLC